MLGTAQSGIGPVSLFQIRGISYNGKSFAPVRTAMRDARTGVVFSLNVIGVLNADDGASGSWTPDQIG